MGHSDESVYRRSADRDAWDAVDRIEALEARADGLESRCRALTAACVVFALGAATLAGRDYMTPTPSTAEPSRVVADRLVAPWVVTSRLTVMDDRGDVFAEMGPASDDHGEGVLTVYNPGTKTRARLSGGMMTLVDHNDKTRVELSSEMQRGGEVRAGVSLGDETGLLRMLLSASADAADIQVRDTRGAKRAAVGVATNDRPYLEMDADGAGLKRVAP